MNKCHIRSHVLYLVRLQMAYEVPFDVLGQGFVFHGHLLYLAFSEDALASFVGILQGFYGMELRYGYQAHSFGQSLADGLDF